MRRHSWLVNIEDYTPLVGEKAVERIMRKAQRLRGMYVVHVSSTFYGGGVAEMLSSATLLARSLGIRADWRLIQGSPDFFSVTKKIHNALQGAKINLTDLKKEIYETVTLQNAMRMDLDGDFVVIHDPQPLPLIVYERRACPWVWRCHVDLSNPNPEIWDYLREFIEQYNAVILSLPEYARELETPQVFIMPAIDPFSMKNAEMSRAEVVRVYFPPDANCLLSVVDHCLKSRHYVNVVVAGKHPAPQWLTMDAAVKHCTQGIGIWQWASNDQRVAPDVVMACCGDVPTLETLAAVSIMREHLPDLKIRVVNVVDLMKLQPQTEHPHGLSDKDFDELFTKDKPLIFAFHGYPWLIHRLTYRRTNHVNLHVRGYKEEGTITTPFDMTVLNDLDRFHLVMDTIDRLPQTGDKGIYLKQQLKDKLIEHKQYTNKHGQDLPEIRNWRWKGSTA